MTAREICYSYRSARHKAQQIQILAELNGVDSLEIIKVLVHGGERLPDSTVNKLFKRLDCNAALYSRRKKHFIFDSINTITASSFR